MATTLPAAVRETEAPARAKRRVYAYLAVRITGMLLAVLVTGHLVVTHVVTDVAGTDSAFIARRWGSALWLTWDVLMLAAALAHAGAGVSVAINDYAGHPAKRRVLNRLLWGVCIVLLGLGSFGIAKAIYS